MELKTAHSFMFCKSCQILLNFIAIHFDLYFTDQYFITIIVLLTLFHRNNKGMTGECCGNGHWELQCRENYSVNYDNCTALQSCTGAQTLEFEVGQPILGKRDSTDGHISRRKWRLGEGRG